MARKKKLEAARIVFPQRLQGPEMPELLQSVLSERGKALVLDLSELTNVGALGVQLLLSIVKTWRNDGLGIELTGVTGELRRLLDILGISVSELGISGEVP